MHFHQYWLKDSADPNPGNKNFYKVYNGTNPIKILIEKELYFMNTYPSWLKQQKQQYQLEEK